MSGVKDPIVNIRRSQYNEMMSAAARARSLEAQTRSLHQQNAAMTASVERALQKNDALSKRLDSVSKKLNAASRETDGLRRDLNAKAAAINASMSDILAATKAGLAEQDKKIRETDARITRINNDQNAKIQSLRTDLGKTREQLAQDIAAARKEAADRISAARNDLQKEIAANHAALDAKISTLANATNMKLNAINKSIADLQAHAKGDAELCKMAGDYLGAASDLLNELVNNFRCELLLPGEAEHVGSMVKGAAAALSEINSGKMPLANAPNAFNAAEDAFNHVLELQKALLNAEQAWVAKRAQAEQALGEAAAAIIAGETGTLETYDPDTGKLVPCDYDIDHWTDGALSSRRSTVEGNQKILSDEESSNSLSMEDLEGIIASAQLITGEMEGIYSKGVALINNSDDRMSIAVDLADIICSKVGMEVLGETSGYEGKDARAANTLHLIDRVTGFEVLVTVSPKLISDPFSGEDIASYQVNTEVLNRGTDPNAIGALDLALTCSMQELGLRDSSGGVPIPTLSTEKAVEKRKQLAGWQAEGHIPTTQVTLE